ncbi:uncharacterized protein TNCV_1962741 [Trichonephila clavipes]|nr:uncharacterized protein TNCV_1962741 [Trichonephila clavipes]
MENMWTMVVQRLSQIIPPAATPDQLWQRVESAWSAVSQEHIQSLFESMSRRVGHRHIGMFCRSYGILRHGGTLNRRRAASPLVRLVERKERWKTPDHPQGVIPQNWGETELNHSVTCMMPKSTTNDGRPLALCHDDIAASTEI